MTCRFTGSNDWRKDMPDPQKLRKWHFLVLGIALVLVAVFLWYWDWRSLGIPKPLRPEHCITIASFAVGFFILGLFVYRLTRKQVMVMLIGLILVNLITALGSLWIYRTYPAFFNFIRPAAELKAYDPDYVNNWRVYFLAPAMSALQIGLLMLWAESLVMFFIRKPADQPE